MQQLSPPFARLSALVDLSGIVLRAAPVDVAADVLEPLPATEEHLIRGAAPMRRAQFSVGRRLARAALSESGTDVRALGADRYGSALWPAGRVGSISHLPDIAMAAVARSRDHAGLGVDVAPSSPLPSEQAAVLLTGDEARVVVDAAGAIGPTVAFAAKEATYKAVHPIVRTEIGYRDVTVAFDVDGTFAATLRASGPGRVRGWWDACGPHVAALAVVA